MHAHAGVHPHVQNQMKIWNIKRIEGKKGGIMCRILIYQCALRPLISFIKDSARVSLSMG